MLEADCGGEKNEKKDGLVFPIAKFWIQSMEAISIFADFILSTAA